MNHSLIGLVVVVLLAPFSLLHAQTPCGNIIAPQNIYDTSSTVVTVPITNCTNPFGETSTDHAKYGLSIDGQTIVHNGTIEVPEGGTSNYQFVGSSGNNSLIPFFRVFRHSGDDYQFVDAQESEVGEVDYRVLAQEHFGTGVDVEEYVQAAIIRDDDNYTDEFKITLYDFLGYVDAHFVPVLPKLSAGTYTLVTREDLLILGNRGFFRNLLEKIIPTAYAQEYVPEVFTFTFTITEQLPESTGASSVLFLPGIQASELAMKEDNGSENKLWVPDVLFNQDVQKLAMNTNGESVNDVYTTKILSSIPLGGTVYDSFAHFMVRLVDTDVIDKWKPFAYDWRYSVTDIAEDGTHYEEGIRDAIDEIEYLASTSFSGKVTIIGHSNGGLLAKAIMRRLETEEKTNLVDKVVLIASPQLGAPKAIGTILHGYDQEKLGGWLIDDVVARGVLANLPGAYGLLPSEKYFEGLTEPIVTFTGDPIVNSYREVYGATISDYTEYTNFIRGADGLDRGLGNPASIPSRANSPLFNEALAMHATQLDNWTAPDGIEVIEVVGTGLPTMKSVEYRGIIENDCFITAFCTPKTEVKPYAVLTHYGDGTVVQRSAEGYGGEKVKYFLNLKALEDVGLDTEYVHHNITEAPPLQDLLSDILISTTTTNNQFISTSHTTFDDPYDVEIIDSPVRLLATDSLGNQTGIILIDGVETIKEDIPGSQYFEFGDTKYFVVPKGTNRTTKLYGEAHGGYTLTTATLNNSDIQTIETTLQNATVTPTMVAEYSNTNEVFSTVVTDSNGDGTTDYETTLDGELIEPEVIITYPLLITTVEALNLSKVRKQALLLIIKSAEYYANKTPSKALYRSLEDGLLKSAQELIKLYVKKRYLTSVDATVVQDMVQVLKDKQ